MAKAGEALGRPEHRMERAAAERAVERIAAGSARLDHDIEEERGTLAELDSAAHGGRLALVGHRTCPDRDRSGARGVLDVRGRRQVALADPHTAAAEPTRTGGRVLPFERCLVSSTWMRSIPAPFKTIDDGHRSSRRHTAFENPEDVNFEIHNPPRSANGRVKQ